MGVGRDPQPSSPLPPLPPHCLPCPCLGAGHGHPAAPAAAPAPRQQQRGGGTRRGHKFPEQTVPDSPGNGVRCFPAQPRPPPPLPTATPKQTQHGRGAQHRILPASPGETEASPHTGAPPATRSRRSQAGREHVGPQPTSHRCPVPPLSCFSSFPSLPEHRPAEGNDPSAIDSPLLPCHCTLPRTALPRDASVALKATSCQRLAPGIFPSPEVEGAPCPPPPPMDAGLLCASVSLAGARQGIAAISPLHPGAAEGGISTSSGCSLPPIRGIWANPAALLAPSPARRL